MFSNQQQSVMNVDLHLIEQSRYNKQNIAGSTDNRPIYKEYWLKGS